MVVNWRLGGVAGAILVGLAAAGCATSDDRSSGSPAPSNPPASPTQSAEEAALAAYEAMWGVVAEASQAGDPNPSELEVYASGDALALMEHALEGAAEDEAVVEGEPQLAPEAVDGRSKTARSRPTPHAACG